MCRMLTQHQHPGPAPRATAALEQLVAEAQEHISGDDTLDMYGSGSVVQRLELEVAAALGKSAAAFVTTGTAANQACVRAAAEQKHIPSSSSTRVALHPTSHLVHLDCLLDGASQSSPHIVW